MNAKKKPITILDIARHAGVSASTVSRVLTGNIPVTADKHAAIMQAVEALGYRPNKIAQSLVNGSSMIIGVLTQHIASPFYGVMISGIERGLAGSPYSPMVVTGNWHENEERHAIDVLLGRQVDAMIILGGSLPDEAIVTLSHELPLIYIGRAVHGLEPYCLTINNDESAYKATSYLIQQGHQKIAHVSGSPDQLDAIERLNGYRQALKDAGLKVDERLIVEGDFREQSGVMALETLLMRGAPFTAIFVANDQMADGVLLGLYNHSLRVPHDVSIIGFDDQPGSAYTIPPLTTVRQPGFEMGYTAARAIVAHLEDTDFEWPTFSAELVVRASTRRT